MPRIIKSENGLISIRLDGAYVSNGKHLVDAYISKDDSKRFFGNFKFGDTKTVKTILQEAVKMTGFEDTVFYGQYPNWVEDEYGESLAVQNRIKFYKSIKSAELVPDEQIQGYIYSLEIHFKKSKDGGIFLVVARAVATSKNANAFNDDLFAEFTSDDPDKEGGVDIVEDVLPF